MFLLAITIKGLTVIFLALLTIVLLLIIMVLLYGFKNFNLLKNETVWRQFILDKIALSILGETEKVKNDSEIRRLLANPDFTRMFLSILIESNKKFSGNANAICVQLFYAFDLDLLAWEKMRSKDPYKIVRGIEALTAMHEKDALAEINALVSHHNPIVASEAQYAVVRFEDFRGLNFITTLTTPLSEWQQIRLLHAISVIPPTIYPFLSTQLINTNTSVIMFVLSLIRKFRIVAFHDEVIALLSHEHLLVRIFAIKTLQDIENKTTIDLLMNFYPDQGLSIKKEILQTLKKSKSKKCQNFLKKVLHDDAAANQILAAEILVTFDEIEYLNNILEDSSKTQHIHSIIKHALRIKL